MRLTLVHIITVAPHHDVLFQVLEWNVLEGFRRKSVPGGRRVPRELFNVPSILNFVVLFSRVLGGQANKITSQQTLYNSGTQRRRNN